MASIDDISRGTLETLLKNVNSEMHKSVLLGRISHTITKKESDGDKVSDRIKDHFADIKELETSIVEMQDHPIIKAHEHGRRFIEAQKKRLASLEREIHALLNQFKEIQDGIISLEAEKSKILSYLSTLSDEDARKWAQFLQELGVPNR